MSPRRFATSALIHCCLACLATLIGCAADPGRTGGWAVGLRVDNPATSLRAQYEVRPNGVLHFAGGLDAGVGGEVLGASADGMRARWTAPLTDAEIRDLVEFLARTPAPATVTPVAGQPNYKGRIDSPSGSHSFVTGATDFTTELERRLRTLRASRLKAD